MRDAIFFSFYKYKTIVLMSAVKIFHFLTYDFEKR